MDVELPDLKSGFVTHSAELKDALSGRLQNHFCFQELDTFVFDLLLKVFVDYLFLGELINTINLASEFIVGEISHKQTSDVNLAIKADLLLVDVLDYQMKVVVFAN